MQYRITAAAVAALVALAPAAWAQDEAGDAAAGEAAPETAAEDPAEGLATGTPVTEEGAEVGQPYFAESFGDWRKRCIRTEDGDDPCQLYQLVEDGQGGSVAEVTVFPLPEGSQAVAGATIVTPLETLLTEQVTISVDGGASKRYPFAFCTQQGCISRIGLTAEDVAAFKAGVAARLRIVPAVAPDQEVSVPISLSGFTAGFDSLSE